MVKLAKNTIMKNFSKLAVELRSLMQSIPETSVDIQVSKSSITKKEDGINIYPADTNLTGTFYHTDELATFCRYHSLVSYCRVVEYKGKTVVCARIL